MLMEGVQLHPGLNSPGPIYQLPGSFEKAAARSKHPIWGQHGPHSLKQGRFRCEEVRFIGKRHMREMQGHFSPGPQYNLPSFVGGSVGNFVASNNRLANTAPANGGRVKLSASDLGGAPSFTLTQGSFSDSKRLPDFEPKETGTAFWRGATMLQAAEPNLVNSSPRPDLMQSWHEAKHTLHDTKIQHDLNRKLAERSRNAPKMPFRQVDDFKADPPFASTFGSASGHTDFGVVGGMDRQWRESKVLGYKGGGTMLGPPPRGGRFRYAFVQPMGPNSVPRDAALADVDGGRITKYAVDRPLNEMLSMGGLRASTSSGALQVAF